MEGLHRFLAIVLADARQRWRTPRLRAWLLVLVAVTWLCFPAADAGYRVLGAGTHRVAYDSAWAGMVVAMLCSWLSLLGFYLVRGTLTRDIESRCWQLLVATPLGRGSYLLAKWASHLLVLGAIAAGMLVVAAIAVVVRGEAPGLDVVALVEPTLLLGGPALGICALCAVLFDLLPPLRRTAGNVLYVVLWVGMLASASAVDPRADVPVRVGDVHGIAVFKRDAVDAAAAQGVAADARRICMLCGRGASATRALRWPAWTPARADVAGRVAWALLPVPLLLLAARGLDRAAAAPTPTAGPRRVRRLAVLRRLLAPLQRGHGSALMSLELQQTLRQLSLPAWAALFVAWGVQLGAAPPTACLAVIAAWALFLPAFARAATRETEFGTAALVYSSAGAVPRLLRVRAGGLLALGVLATAPALLRFAASEPLIAVALGALVVSLAAWALALGALTGSSRPFEALFAIAALLALNGVGVLDASVAPRTTLFAHAAGLPLALLLLVFSWPRATRAAGSA